jgi:hypothetical protein
MHSKKTIICTLTLATALFAGCTEDLPERLTEPVPSVPVPTNLSAVLGDNQVTLSWSSDAGYSYSGFVIYRNETGETPARLATASTPPYVDNGVRTGAIYEYRVAGVSSGGIEGAPSTALLVRPTVFSAAINAGANYTNTRNVTLNLGAPVGTQLVRFSEDPGFAGAAWITFTTPIPFQLSAGDGLKTVYFEFTDEFGHPTESISDQITLDTETAIQSASFTPTTPATPGALLHFTVTPVGTELQGSAEILVPGRQPQRRVRTRQRAVDHGPTVERSDPPSGPGSNGELRVASLVAGDRRQFRPVRNLPGHTTRDRYGRPACQFHHGCFGNCIRGYGAR